MTVAAIPAEGKTGRGRHARSGRFQDSGIDLSHEPLRGIRWHEQIVRFSFHTHARLVIALLLAVFGATGLFLGTLRVAVRPPVVAQAVPARSQRTRQRSTPKSDRLPPAPIAGHDMAATLVEAQPDGSAGEFTYRRVEVALSEPAAGVADNGQSLFYQESAPPARPSPFDVLLARPHAIQPPTGDRESGPDAAAFQRREEPDAGRSDKRQRRGRAAAAAYRARRGDAQFQAGRGDTLLAAAGVSGADRRSLTDALNGRTVDPSDHLDLLLEKPASPGGTARLAAVRLHDHNGVEMFLARGDDGGFRQLANHDLFDRIAAEAADAGRGASAAKSDDAYVARGHTPLMRRLHEAKVPADVAAEIVDLARANGLGPDDDASADRSVDLIFRTGADGRSDLVSATFHGREGDKTFYRYRSSATGLPEFFDEQGRSVSKMLMAKPVANGRLGDGFAWRLHPILKRWLHHNGVDYTAPYGSPVVAAGDGRVVMIGWQPGYGKYVRLQHDSGYFTTYAHISRVPPTLKVGQYVKQGQVVAYIGSTGLSTGPHLYYELRIGGRYYDPTSTRLPAGTRLTGARLDALRRQITHVEKISRYIRCTVAAAVRSPDGSSCLDGKQANTAELAAPG